MDFPVASVMHPTDFSDLSANAFAHALKISLIVKAKLYIVHVAKQVDENAWFSFPHVRQILTRWGLIEESVAPFELGEKLGIEIIKVEVDPQDDPVEGFSRFFAGHPSDLLVLATHGREGLHRWLQPSVAEAMSRRSGADTLFLSPHCSGFVDQTSGAMKVKHVLVPIDHTPPAGPALGTIRQFCQDLAGVDVEFHVVHIGTTTPSLGAEVKPGSPVRVELRGGNVVEGILQAAVDVKADLIAMATAGPHGILDALHGSTTERVLRHAPCPVFAVPVSAQR
jgi:nucleotide-binding universal stress UspA family protein